MAGHGAGSLAGEVAARATAAAQVRPVCTGLTWLIGATSCRRSSSERALSAQCGVQWTGGWLGIRLMSSWGIGKADPVGSGREAAGQGRGLFGQVCVCVCLCFLGWFAREINHFGGPSINPILTPLMPGGAAQARGAAIRHRARSGGDAGCESPEARRWLFGYPVL